MAIVRPFKALRPAPEYAEKVVSLPYDVMKRKEAAEMAKGNPYSYLHICRAEIDLPDQEDPYDKSVYLKAKSNIYDFYEKGIFIREEKPAFYVYRQKMDGRVQTGFVGCASIDDYVNDIIKKHELTRKDKEIDRINHFTVCNANTEPVFFTYKQNQTLADIIAKVTEGAPEYDIVDDNGVAHILWVVKDDELCHKIENTFKDQIDYMYIADGHHRSASAVHVGLEKRKENPGYTGEEEFNYFMAVIFPDEDLAIFDYNRLIKDFNGYTKEDYLKKVEENFIVEKIQTSKAYRPEALHTFGMYIKDGWYKLTAKEGTYDEDHPIDSLDVSILQKNLLSPILGVENPRTDRRIDFAGGIRGLGELERRVNEDMEIAFSLYPVSIDQLIAVADAGLLMPPKSTWFEPKLGSGLFIHEL
ncbi:MAG: DUF1015 domain-containing protein [Firmicutes bacterium]|nr:DUF1015 domain-containing protein [Bacillota bacterium]